MKRLGMFVLALLVSSSLAFGQAETYQRFRLGAGSSSTLAEVSSVQALLVSTSAAAAAATDQTYTTFPRVRIAGGTTGNLAEVDSTGHLLVAFDTTTAQSVLGLTITGTSGNTLVVDTPTLIVDATNHRVGIGTAPTTPKFHVQNTLSDPGADTYASYTRTTATLTAGNTRNIYGVYGYGTMDTNGQAHTTGSLVGVEAFAATTGSSGSVAFASAIKTDITNTTGTTMTTATGVTVNAPSNTGTLGTYQGVNVVATTVGTTATYGLRSQITAAATRWNLYLDGTGQNYLLGNVGIGSGKTTPAVALDVAGTINSTGYFTIPPTTQTIAATNTITADACGGVKQITAAGAVATNTTDTFTAPAAGNTGCMMMVCNVGVTNAITLDKNTHFFTVAGADVVLLANSCIGIVSDGTQWRQTTAQLTAS